MSIIVPQMSNRSAASSRDLLAGVQERHISDSNIYSNGAYLQKNPLWHIDESPFKVKQILRMITRHHLQSRTICDVGCGAGEVLRLLQQSLGGECRFYGYDISPQAVDMCKQRANEKLEFKLADINWRDDLFFDLVLVLDVFEHVEDYFGFLHAVRPKGRLKIFHIPLDLSVQAVLRKRGLLKRRELWGHIHYFSKETALETLKSTGYKVLDYFYTPRGIELATETVHKVVLVPRKFCFAIHQDLTARILGGYGLLVLAE